MSSKKEDLPADNLQSTNIEADQKDSANLDHNHLRLQHRLQTARFTVWGGGVAIVALTMISFLIPVISEEGQSDVSAIYEILRTSIATLASIVTLALGYIAGSNIDNN